MKQQTSHSTHKKNTTEYSTCDVEDKRELLETSEWVSERETEIRNSETKTHPSFGYALGSLLAIIFHNATEYANQNKQL